jgi:Heavy metal binding domain
MCDTHRRAFLTRSIFVLGAVAAGASLAVAGAQTPATTAKWVCPPCGCPSDGKEFDAPGSCPSCGMTLIQKPVAAAPAAPAKPETTPSPASPTKPATTPPPLPQ